MKAARLAKKLHSFGRCCYHYWTFCYFSSMLKLNISAWNFPCVRVCKQIWFWNAFRTWVSIRVPITCYWSVNSTSLFDKFLFNSCFSNLFSVPRTGQVRLEWIKSISKFQEFDFFSTKYMVCEHHFPVNEISCQKGKYFLPNRVAPTIFPSTSHLDHSSMQPQLVHTNSMQYNQLTDGNQVCKIKYCRNEKRPGNDALFFR